MNLTEKIVLVTGASKGIGKETAIAFAKEGCSVIVNYKSDAEGAQAVVDECNQYSKGNMIVPADVSVESEVEKMFAEIQSQYGHLDILVNNAGIFSDGDSPTNVEAFEEIFRNNLLSCVLTVKHALPLMKPGNISKIINVSSINGKLGRGRPGAAAYSALKAALENYTLNLAKDVAPDI